MDVGGFDLFSVCPEPSETTDGRILSDRGYFFGSKFYIFLISKGFGQTPGGGEEDRDGDDRQNPL